MDTRRHDLRTEQGFTLIELLVVILIIGILAAIALPSFLNQRQKGFDSEAKEQARSAQIAAESFYVNELTYAPLTAAALQGIEPSLAEGQGSTLAVSGTSSEDYTVSITSKSGTNWTIDKTATTLTRSCDNPGHGSCPASGKW